MSIILGKYAVSYKRYHLYGFFTYDFEYLFGIIKHIYKSLAGLNHRTITILLCTRKIFRKFPVSEFANDIIILKIEIEIEIRIKIKIDCFSYSMTDKK